MSKPSIAQLLDASGLRPYTPALMQRAMAALHGNVGANADERDWQAIMQSGNPLQAAEDALKAMYQDGGYLLRNADHLVQSGHVAAQVEITYRQLAERLGYTHDTGWSAGSAYAGLASLSMQELIALVAAGPGAPPGLPTIKPSNGAHFSGTAEAGNTIVLTDGADNPIGQTVADAGGLWSFTPGIPLANGTVVKVEARNSAGASSGAASTTVDAIPPAPADLSLAGSTLSIASEPGAALTVTASLGAVSSTATLTADNAGRASLDLITEGIFTWDQLLAAQVSVTGRDAAGNQSVASVAAFRGLLTAPVTIGGLDLDATVNPLAPRFNLSGATEGGSAVVIRVITPTLNVELLPIQADASGNFSLNLLAPTVLAQLGLNISDVLNLGAQISFHMVATAPGGRSSAAYGATLQSNGAAVDIKAVSVSGNNATDVMSGTGRVGEQIHGNGGHDLILDVGTGDSAWAGAGHDTIQITAADFGKIDGGAGFDTVILANGISLDYGAPGTGTLENIERIDLGRGGPGSTLTLSATQVAALTGADNPGNTLQVTGDHNDVLNILGAVRTGTTQLIGGFSYDVYHFGDAVVLVGSAGVQVVTA